jgi:hypothetical protein
VNAFIPRDVEVADKLALARLDDDGAPPAVTWPQISDGRARPSRDPPGSYREGGG